MSFFTVLDIKLFEIEPNVILNQSVFKRKKIVTEHNYFSYQLQILAVVSFYLDSRP